MNSFIWTRKFKKYDGRPSGFQGRYYRKNPGINWKPYIPLVEKPIKYLEIGCADGGNVIHIGDSYGKHPNSELYCVDPWIDYDEYPEYKGQQEIGWKTFNLNISHSNHFSKIRVHRGFSDDIVPTFKDSFFDIIYVDGNHETEYVYRDAVMSLKKVKTGGFIIFDDYDNNWPQTVKGIDRFLDEYKNKLQIITNDAPFGQLIIKKI